MQLCSAYMLRVGGWNDTDANHEYDRNAWRIWFSLEIEHCLISAMLFSQISAVTDLWGNWWHISLVLQTKQGILWNPYRKENHPPQNELYNFMMAHIEMMRCVLMTILYGHADHWARLDYVWIHPRCTSFMISLWTLEAPNSPRQRSGFRRVKNVFVQMEWTPDLGCLACISKNRRVGKETRSKRLWFLVCNGNGVRLWKSNIPAKAHLYNQKYPPSSHVASFVGSPNPFFFACTFISSTFLFQPCFSFPPRQGGAMQGTLTVGHCGGVGNAQKTACFGCLDPDILSLSFRFFVLFVFLINGR